jgi:hydrogenase nickel incorporation protein HypB
MPLCWYDQKGAMLLEKVRILEVKQSVFANNDAQAEKLREELKQKGIYLLNLMSSPGSGKTTTLTRLIELLKEDLKIGVMEADIDSDVDAVTIAATGAKAIQLHTGGMCHLDAAMTRQGLDGLDAGEADLVVLENVGNLVCPAEFDTGAVKNMAILSVPEGHDKPLKYPLMFQVCDAVLINKIDVAPYFDFDFEKCTEYIRMRNPKAVIFPISAKTGEGIEAVADWLKEEVKNWKGV